LHARVGNGWSVLSVESRLADDDRVSDFLFDLATKVCQETLALSSDEPIVTFEDVNKFANLSHLVKPQITRTDKIGPILPSDQKV
jgi:hypothetical protein